MSELSLRPRFQVRLPLAPEAVLAHFESCMSQPDAKASGTVVQHHVMVRVPRADLHYWSPQLDMEVEADEDGGGTLIRGLVGPSAGVWTKFIFLYSATGFAAVVGSVIAMSQWMLHKPNYGVWILIAALLGILGTWVMGQTGKRLAHDQTWQLKYFVDECLDELKQPFTP